MGCVRSTQGFVSLILGDESSRGGLDLPGVRAVPHLGQQCRQGGRVHGLRQVGMEPRLLRAAAVLLRPVPRTKHLRARAACRAHAAEEDQGNPAALNQIDTDPGLSTTG